MVLRVSWWCLRFLRVILGFLMVSLKSMENFFLVRMCCSIQIDTKELFSQLFVLYTKNLSKCLHPKGTDQFWKWKGCKFQTLWQGRLGISNRENMISKNRFLFVAILGNIHIKIPIPPTTFIPMYCSTATVTWVPTWKSFFSRTAKVENEVKNWK